MEDTKLLEEINLYPQNAKIHPDSQLEKIALSLRTYGWRQPIVLDTSKDKKEIIVGHGRYLAWKKYPDGIKTPWIINHKGETISGEPETRALTSEEIRAYRLMDNKSNESNWEMDLLLEELKIIEDLGIDLALTGFDNFAIDGNDPNSEWLGMPEFNQEDISGYKRLIVTFDNEKDYQDFAKLINQNLTDKTRSIWFPKKEKETFVDKEYINES